MLCSQPILFCAFNNTHNLGLEDRDVYNSFLNHLGYSGVHWWTLLLCCLVFRPITYRYVYLLYFLIVLPSSRNEFFLRGSKMWLVTCWRFFSWLLWIFSPSFRVKTFCMLPRSSRLSDCVQSSRTVNGLVFSAVILTFMLMGLMSVMTTKVFVGVCFEDVMLWKARS